jgi:hypothetical protein
MYCLIGANIGDVSNHWDNWAGRLVSNTWRLTEWFIGSV